jgi:hypothetical protein
MSDILSKLPIKLTIVEKGEATGYLNRLTAPLTVEEILKKLPINSRTSPAMGFVSVILSIKRGPEKPVNSLKAGSISYWPRGDSLVICPRDFKSYGPVNRIGEVTDGIELFNGVRSGTRILIERI